ncbi:MAG: lanthionine synthetase C family protein [Trebonia sp.]
MTTRTAEQAPAQSLARGAAGTALLRVEQAMAGTGTWAAAHAAITSAAAEPLDAGPGAALYAGAPALAFVLLAARADGQPRYQAAASELNRHVLGAARKRLAAARDRRRRGEVSFRDFDVFYGLTGIGALLMLTSPGSEELAGVLEYLAGLARPRLLGGTEVPGWLVPHDPDPLMPTPGGHINLGVAHGGAGILALISLSASRGIATASQREAIGFLCGFFGQWRLESPDGPWWPQWLTRDELAAGVTGQRGPGRPSWCYGTPGITRALQLAAIASGDRAGQAAAEEALAASLAPAQLARLTGPGLCHGPGGAYVTALRAAQDALTPAIAQRLPGVAACLHTLAPCSKAGLLTGDTGTQLALEAAQAGTPPRSGWDACLLIT